VSVYTDALSGGSVTDTRFLDLLATAVFTENVAECQAASGGALYVGGGRAVALKGATLENHKVSVTARSGSGGAAQAAVGPCTSSLERPTSRNADCLEMSLGWRVL
jgi:predicted outer membrane repeat protein